MILDESDPLGLGLSTETILREILFLQCLREAGVDNWEGYEHAQTLFQERV